MQVMLQAANYNNYYYLHMYLIKDVTLQFKMNLKKQPCHGHSVFFKLFGEQADK